MLIPFAVCRDKEWWNRSKVWLERIHRTDPRNHPIRDGCASISREEARTEWRQQQGLLIRPVGKWSERNRSRVVRAMHFYCIIGVDIRWNAGISGSFFCARNFKALQITFTCQLLDTRFHAIEKNFSPFLLLLFPILPRDFVNVTEVLIFARLE